MSALLTHLPTAPFERTLTLDTSVPEKLTRKQPLFMRSSSLPCKTKSPVKRLKPTQEGRDPNSTYRRPGIPLWNTNDNKNITHTQHHVKSEPLCTTHHPPKTAPTSAHQPQNHYANPGHPRRSRDHHVPLLCEELTLRARLDLDQGRLDHATIELDRAPYAAPVELADEEAIRHALARLEAALRARSAAGYDRS